MIIDCDECAARGPACGDCVVSVLLGGPPDDLADDPDPDRPLPLPAAGSAVLELDDTERWAVHNLAAAGLVPPLRMVPLSPGRWRATSSTESETAMTQRRRTAG